MISITKAEAVRLREEIRDIHIRRTVHKRYVEEAPKVLEALSKIREEEKNR